MEDVIRELQIAASQFAQMGEESKRRLASGDAEGGKQLLRKRAQLVEDLAVKVGPLLNTATMEGLDFHNRVVNMSAEAKRVLRENRRFKLESLLTDPVDRDQPNRLEQLLDAVRAAA